MVNNLKQQLTTGWHPMRWVALALGSFIGYQAIVYQDVFSAILAIFLLYQVVTNTGCLVGVCAPKMDASNKNPDGNVNNKEYSDIEFTEVEN